jgi:pyruvate,water dikinase
LRTCARGLGGHLVATGAVDHSDDVFFCTRNEVAPRVAGKAEPIVEIVRERRHLWQSQRSLAAPLTLGRPPRLSGDVIDRAVRRARFPRRTRVRHPRRRRHWRRNRAPAFGAAGDR